MHRRIAVFTGAANTLSPHEARTLLTLKAPAGRAVRLDGGDAKDCVKGEAVEVPGRWSRAGSAIRRCERLALHFRRPPALAVEAGHRLQCRPIGHPGRFALQDEVDTLQAHGDRAGRVLLKIARLAGARPAGEIEISVVPEGADAGGMRPPVWSRRAEEDLGQRRVGEEIARPAPRQLRGSVAIEIGDFDWRSLSHRCPPVPLGSITSVSCWWGAPAPSSRCRP